MANRYEKMFNNQGSSIARDIHKLSKLMDPNRIPREDLTEDHHLWLVVLSSAKELWPDNPYVFTTLHGLRCCGARLQENDTATGLKLLPGEISQAEWALNRSKYLDPIKNQIVELFRYSTIGLLIKELMADEPENEPAPSDEQTKMFK